VARVKSVVDYKTTQIILNVDELHYEDMINLHLQVTNMLHKGVTKANLDAKNLKEALENKKKQVKIERAMVQSRAKRVRELEKKIIQLRYDPNKVEHVKKFFEEKYNVIMTMKRRIKKPDACPIKTTKWITNSLEIDKMLEQLSELSLKS